MRSAALSISCLVALTLAPACVKVERRSGTRVSDLRVELLAGKLTQFGLVLTRAGATPESSQQELLHPNLALRIPPHAVTEDVDVRVYARYGDPRLPSVVPTFEIEPIGLRLALPAQFTIEYTPLYELAVSSELPEPSILAFSLAEPGETADSLHPVREIDIASNAVTCSIVRFGSYYAMHGAIYAMTRQPTRLLDPAVQQRATQTDGRLFEVANGVPVGRVGTGDLESFWSSPASANLLVLHGLLMSPYDLVGNESLLPRVAGSGFGARFQNIVAFQYASGRSIRASANALYDQIVRNRRPGFGCNLVAHSAGGLVARYAIERSHLDPARAGYRLGDPPLADFIENAVFLATPHRGSVNVESTFGDLLRTLEIGGPSQLPGVAELVPGERSFTERLNATWSAPRTRYFSIAADRAPQRDDGLVTVDSALGLPTTDQSPAAFLVLSGSTLDHLSVALFAARFGVIEQARAWFGVADGNSLPLTGSVGTPVGTQSGRVDVGFALVDHDGDLCRLTPMFRRANGNWQRATSASPLIGIASSPAPGQSMSVSWDSRADEVGVDGPELVMVRIACEDPSGIGFAGETGLFWVDNS